MLRSCLLLSCLALAACGGDGVLPAHDQIVTGAIPETVSVEQPSTLLLELPAEMGTVQQVREHSYVNAYRQEISLRGGEHGENVVEVTVGAPAGGVGSLQVGRPSEGGVRGEIIARFHDIPMRIVTSPLGNAAGPFGLAIGKSADGTRCVFAWQWIDDVRAQNGGGGSGIASMLASAAAPASVRVRLCRKNATVDELANLVQQIRPVGGSAVDRALASGARRPAAVAMGAPVSSLLVADAARADTVPVGATLESALGGSSDQKAALAAPKPGVARASRPRRARHARAAPAVAAMETVVPPAPYANAPRYMAPVPGAAASQAPGAGYGAPAGAAFNPQLPAVAYRGPQRGGYAPAY